MTRRAWVAPAAFLALSAAFWFPELSGRRALFYDIMFSLAYPNAALLGSALSRGFLPFWNPHVFCGVPFLANIQTGLFYPTACLFALLSFPAAAAVLVWLHYAFAGWGMHLYCRQKGFSAAAAAAAGVVYGFNGFLIGHYAYLENVAAFLWLPLILRLLGRARASGARRDVLAAGLAGALEIFAGHPQFALYTAAAAAFVFLEDELSMRSAGTLFWAGLAALAFSAVQWLPALAFIKQSPRLASSTYDAAAVYSLTAADMARMLLEPLWNRHFVPASGDPNTVGFYFGLPVLLLSLWGLGAGRRARGLAVLAAAGLLLALGRHGPLFPAAYALLPPVRWLRFPCQAVFLCCFGLAGLSGLGLDRLRAPGLAAWGLVALIAADLLLFSRRAVVTIDPAFYAAEEPTPAYLRSATGGQYRFMMTPRTRDNMGRTGPTELAAWLAFRDSLYPNLAAAEGLLDAWGRQELRYASYDGVLSALSKDPRSPWMDALSIRYLLTFGELPAPKFRLARSGSLRVYENASALPRAYFCPRAVSVLEGEEQAYLDSHPRFDFRQALLRAGPAEADRAAGTARLVADGGDGLALLCDASGPGWVVVTDAFDPGWAATVNGRPAPIERVNAVQRAVRVEGGRSLIEMRYRPVWWRPGAAISAASLGAGLLWAL